MPSANRNGNGLKTLPAADRPRERLLANGGASLTDAELIAVLLRTGRPGQTAVEMARELLDELGGLVGLVDAHSAQLCRHGLRQAKAATVAAAIELGSRLARAQLPDRHPIDKPVDVARYLSLRYGTRDQEVVGALYIDVRHRLIGEREIFRGTLSRTVVEPRGVLKEALLAGASSFILFHTHPSGDPAPSADDLAFTRRMAEAGEIVGVTLLDHLVIARGGRWVSLRRHGGW